MYQSGHQCVARSSGVHHITGKGGEMCRFVVFNDIQSVCAHAYETSANAIERSDDLVLHPVAFQCVDLLFGGQLHGFRDLWGFGT